MNFKKILLVFFFSQIFCLWVFWEEENEVYFVVESSSNLCWEFIKWTAEKNNWLPNWYEAVFLNDEINTKFVTNLSCQSWNISACCKELWYRYAWISIGQKDISEERSATEYLARKNIIMTHSFDPANYMLDSSITRKELMKIIMKISKEKVREECREIFTDVKNDWGCKYIESALEFWYIAWNQKFRPNDFVTKSEAIKLILQAQNIKKRYQTTSWQQDYISTAYYLWFIDQKFNSYNEFASRWYIFSTVSRSLNY